MSDSVRPHRQQPTSLRHWDSPGKNTGVGCHFLLQCMKVKSQSEVAKSCPTLSDPMDCSPPGSSIHGIFQARVLEWGAIAFSGGQTEPSPKVSQQLNYNDWKQLGFLPQKICNIIIPMFSNPGSSSPFVWPGTNWDWISQSRWLAPNRT